MTERIFAMLFILNLVGPALTLVVGLLLLGVPAKTVAGPAEIPSRTVAHA